MEKEEQISVKNVPPELKRRAQIVAIQQDRSLSDVIRELLKDWTEKHEAKGGKQAQSPTK